MQKNRTGWLDSAPYDLILIVGILILALTAGTLSIALNHYQFLIMGIVTWYFGYHHVIAGFVKMAGTKADRKRNYFLIYYLPIITLIGVGLIAYFIGAWAIITIYFYWQWYHYTRQSYGIAAHYRRKLPESQLTNKYLSLATLWCVPLWGILHRSTQMDKDFFGQDLFLVPVPQLILFAVAVASVFLVAYWAVSVIQDYFKGEMSWGYALFMASHHVIFFVAYVVIENPTIGWVTVTVWHNAQYMMFVWRDNGARTSYSDEKSVLKWLSARKPVRILLYFLITMALTAVFYKAWQWAPFYINQALPEIQIGFFYYIVVNQSINFHHYMIDAVMWKRKKA